ncbi:hypothetical protein L0244_29090 [bacterium]|nr:hypothetical protein [bacterium]
MVDHSIDTGAKKALVVLRAGLAMRSEKGRAIRLEDCQCIGLKVCEQVNGETIASDLEGIFKQAGKPEAILKDGDYTLQKGVRLWTERLNKLPGNSQKQRTGSIELSTMLATVGNTS